MRVRGRRIVLLIAGALPLLAEDDVSAGIETTPIGTPEHYQQQEEKEPVVETTAALHDRPLSLLPLNLLQIESDILDESQANQALTAKAVLSHPDLVEDDGIEEEEQGETLKDTGQELNDVDGIESMINEEEKTEANENVSGNGSTDVQEMGSEDEISNTSDPAVDQQDDKQQNVGIVASLNSTILEDGQPAVFEPQELLIPESINQYTLENSQAETKEFDGEMRNSTDATSFQPPEETEGDDKTPTDAPSEIQQPTGETQVDQVDDDEEGSISNRVAVDYASKSAGALVLEKSANFKGTSNLLNGDRDKYAISPCQEKKFVVLSLSEDILVKQVKLVNYELYSSRVKDFRIQISQTMGNWVDLGSYTASPASGAQTFDLIEPAWGRYLKFKFTSHYGDEFYCTLTQIMVHGSTMIQGFHEHLQESNEEEEEEVTPETVNESNDHADAAPDKESEPVSSKSDTNIEDTGTETQAKGREEKQSEEMDRAEEKEAFNTADAEENAGEKAVEPVGDDMNNTSDDLTMVVNNTTNNMLENLEENNETHKMHSKKLRNFSTALPAASIGLSSEVFTTIIGRLEPLHLKSVQRLSNMHALKLPDSQHFQTILAKASDSTRAIKKALTDPALLDNLQLWNEASIEKPFPPEAFGSTAIGPREQNLAEKLTAYIEDADNDSAKTDNDEQGGADDEAADNSSPSEEYAAGDESTKNSTEANKAAVAESGTQHSASPADEHSTTGKASPNAIEDGYVSLHDTDMALAQLLDKLPSIECLKKLDFTAFKEKVSSRKGGHGTGGHAAPGNQAEPIFKMLTDQIKALQSNLSVHDQFTKEAVQCYQRVLLDLVVELETMRFEHEARLSKLEEGLDETKTVRWIFVIYQLVMGLPHWASLLAATFFTSFVSPNAVSKPLQYVQNFLDKHLSEGDHIALSWTITVCMMALCVVATISMCQRIMTLVSNFQSGVAAERTPAAQKDPSEEDSCRFTVQTADGEVVSVNTKPAVDSSSSESASNDNESVAAANDASTPRLEKGCNKAGSEIIVETTAELQETPDRGTATVVNQRVASSDADDKKTGDRLAASVVSGPMENTSSGACFENTESFPSLYSSLAAEESALFGPPKPAKKVKDNLVADQVGEVETPEDAVNATTNVQSLPQLVSPEANGTKPAKTFSRLAEERTVQDVPVEAARNADRAEQLVPCRSNERGDKENVQPGRMQSRPERISEADEKGEIAADELKIAEGTDETCTSDDSSENVNGIMHAQEKVSPENETSIEEDGIRASSGLRTPDIEADSNLERAAKGSVSPSSVARVSGFAETASDCGEARPESEPDGIPSESQVETSTQDQRSTNSLTENGAGRDNASKQKRRSSL